MEFKVEDISIETKSIVQFGEERQLILTHIPTGIKCEGISAYFDKIGLKLLAELKNLVEKNPGGKSGAE